MTRSKLHASRRSGFEPDESQHLRLRSELMAVARKLIEDRSLTQARAAIIFGVPQPRVSNLIRGKVERFTIDALIGMLARAGVLADLQIRYIPRWRAREKFNLRVRRTPSLPPAP